MPFYMFILFIKASNGEKESDTNSNHYNTFDKTIAVALMPWEMVGILFFRQDIETTTLAQICFAV